MQSALHETLRKSEIAGVLERICQALELSDTQHELAKSRYEAVGNWLADADHPILETLVIYSQGSVSLGTTVKPIGQNEHDVQNGRRCILARARTRRGFTRFVTTLFDRYDLRPATHVMVVGVGRYQYVDDPSRPKVLEFELGQLTSPVVSARAITDWLLIHHRNDEVPLGSVELLLSAPDRHYRSPDGSIDKDVEPANLANVRRAWDDWFGRCDRDAGNIAIFFFSGHGVSKSHLTLLMDDFGENERRLFENAVDFDASHDAMMTSCRARVQCFFADACRQVPYAVLDRERVEGQVLADRLLAQYMAEDAPRFYATAPTDSAYGLTNKATLYTKPCCRR